MNINFFFNFYLKSYNYFFNYIFWINIYLFVNKILYDKNFNIDLYSLLLNLI